MTTTAPLLVAIMGATGTGKSTFVNIASGGTFGVGNGLISCTSQVGISQPFDVHGRKAVLIDTPGFDDTNMSDIDILKMIAVHLNLSYEAGMKLSGIIYMHRISDFRMGGISRRNFNMFRKLCGESTLKNVLIVTTMWGLVDPAVAEAREKELMQDDRLFKPVLDKGAIMVRHDNTQRMAHAIIHRILENHPMPLQIQKEMVEEKKDISETAAAVELDRELAAMAEKHKRELAQVRVEMEEAISARDEEAKQELQEMRTELEEKLRQNEHDRTRLSEEYAAEKRRADETLAQIQADIAEQRSARIEGEKRFGEMQQMWMESNQKAAEERALMLQQMTALANRPVKRGICTIQ